MNASALPIKPVCLSTRPDLCATNWTSGEYECWIWDTEKRSWYIAQSKMPDILHRYFEGKRYALTQMSLKSLSKCFVDNKWTLIMNCNQLMMTKCHYLDQRLILLIHIRFDRPQWFNRMKIIRIESLGIISYICIYIFVFCHNCMYRH